MVSETLAKIGDKCWACRYRFRSGDTVRHVPIYHGFAPAHKLEPNWTMWCLRCADSQDLIPTEKESYTWGNWPEGFRTMSKRWFDLWI